MRYVVIMAGGSGTRLWPLSRQGMPKQLLPLVDGKSLLRLAFERSLASVPAERVLIVTGAAYADAVAADLPEVPVANILGEPTGRDSLNAVAWPAAVLHAQDPDAVIAQVTADQLIEPVEVFASCLETAFALAEADPTVLVTLGVVPTSAHTGYGYLHRGAAIDGFTGAHEVVQFAEKPALELAEQYVASGEYWWNAGMFVWRAETLLGQLRQLLPATYASVLELAAQPTRLAEIFPTLFKTSVDYAVMEPVSAGRGSAHVAAVAMPVDWRDVGGYASLAEILAHDESGNAVSGNCVQLSAANNVVVNTDDDSVIALLGVSGLVVVRTPMATLVARAEDAERIKELVAEVASKAGPAFA
ncbi:MAG: NTP transferase domain-containing protein [Propionicimonas sp.]|uniref:mannose-1-phosphate guanylyltransferase n=1 Tax=Propionicimonas sp. TaxID=1955623 RepID=UPI001DCBFB33|nr:mannose-1-phosphate guanylyltransferase [Propionicimonas sp.]MBU4187576.1 NTP transferase domain-containing protein [Actinomycetota bacterium]MBU4206768.1 NTP transferase domain-containing protein [Actinomycetota bacterium]MBU4251014.1 NTP transferase domain-containing protein [Actinomycetota bacterium]MBU4364564.1 NTP transferase domain-containing protein [Actinomycetota bacterium]MBU4417046.1 NTP transferase domain-containing protein [Actinomycetota bacterium]